MVVVFDDLEVELADQLEGWHRLARTGLQFDRAFVTTPLCCPSRASILTGRYAHNHGVLTNDTPDGGHKRAREMGLERCTVAVWLKQAGYTTAMMGKYLNGYGFESLSGDLPPGWDTWVAMWQQVRVLPERYVLNIDGTLTRPPTYQTDELADRAVRFIADASATDSPFFLYLAPAPPHRPWHPASRHASAEVPRYAEQDRYRMMLAGIDLLERVVEEAPDDTYIIVTSDNGYHLEPTPGKSSPIYVDIHVPFFLLGPDVPVFARDEIVANIDIAPTIADWAGIRPPDNVDGTSLVPLMSRTDVEWRQSLTVEAVGRWTAEVTDTQIRVDYVRRPDRVFDIP